MKSFFYAIATDQIDNGFVKIIKAVLWALSVIYGFCVRGVLILYKVFLLRKKSLPQKVISVGNITLGGVGKTPFVELVTHLLLDKGKNPVVLMRGYMDKSSSQRTSGVVESDEAALLKQSLGAVPVLVGKDRAKSICHLPANYPVNAFILDDGFQHWKLKRDLDIVLIDSTNPFGNGHLLPRGILREPLSSLRRAQMFVVTKTDAGKANVDNIKNQLGRINKSAAIVEAVHHPLDLRELKTNKNIPLSFLDEKTVCSFCSIGDPDSFICTLKSLRAEIDEHISFMDHHVYHRRDIQKINKICRKKDIKMVLTTQKDAVKLERLLEAFDDQIAVYSLRIIMQIVGGADALKQQVFGLFSDDLSEARLV